MAPLNHVRYENTWGDYLLCRQEVPLQDSPRLHELKSCHLLAALKMMVPLSVHAVACIQEGQRRKMVLMGHRLREESKSAWVALPH